MFARLCLMVALVLSPGFVYSAGTPVEGLQPPNSIGEAAEDNQGGAGVGSYDRLQGESGPSCPLPDPFRYTSPDPAKEPSPEDTFFSQGEGAPVTEQVREIAEDLAADDDEPIQNAFVHGPDELHELAVPLEFKEAVDHYIVYFSTKKRKVFLSWLKRARRYAPLLKKILADKGLPGDLVYLAMIESGFNPKAYSCMKASGPWQFISETGQRYGLRIDHWIDERRDFEKATVAAAQYLKDLFDQFGCWYLAASGYNAGEGRVERAIKRHGTDDYWRLYRYNTLPRETREYIPQLIAAAAISENPERYGFSDPGEETPVPLRKKLVPGGTPLALVAEAASSDPAEVRSLNPELMTLITPPGKHHYQVKLPGDASLERFDEKLKSRLRGRKVIGTVRVAAPGQRTLKRILKRYGVGKDDLALVNRGGIRAGRGRTVYVPLFERLASEKPARVKVRTTSYRIGHVPTGKNRTWKDRRGRAAAALKGRWNPPARAPKISKGRIETASGQKANRRVPKKIERTKKKDLRRSGTAYPAKSR